MVTTDPSPPVIAPLGEAGLGVPPPPEPPPEDAAELPLPLCLRVRETGTATATTMTMSKIIAAIHATGRLYHDCLFSGPL